MYRVKPDQNRKRASRSIRGRIRLLVALFLAAGITLALWTYFNRPVSVVPYSGKISGLAFSPFRAGESPLADTYPDKAQLWQSLELAARYTHRIRIYGVQGTLADIPALAEPLGLKIMLGAWIDSNKASNAAELKEAVKLANTYSDVQSLAVGNEVILRHNLTVAQLILLIDRVKKEVHVPVTEAEPWEIWLKYPKLAHSVDFITVHLLPYWEGIPVRKAVKAVFLHLQRLEKAYPGKKVVIGETGWPSNGEQIKGAVPNLANQAYFIRHFLNEAAGTKIHYFLMEAFDQPWKMSQEGKAGGYWGIFNVNLQPKWSLTKAVEDHPGWRLWAFIGVIFSFCTALIILWRKTDLTFFGQFLFAALTQAFATAVFILLMLMQEAYLSFFGITVWLILIIAQGVLLFALLGDGFEFVEILFAPFRREYLPGFPEGGLKHQPFISVHIPVCNEPPEMVKETLQALAAVRYDNYEVLVIDNNTKDQALWQPVEAFCRELGERFRFFHLEVWPGYKAGALNFALNQAKPESEIIAVLDSDYKVDKEWLQNMIGAFSDPETALVQSPQDYRDGNRSFFKKCMFWEYAGFFYLGMKARNEHNAIILHGTMTLIRKKALVAVGGWPEKTITEDADLGLKLFRSGFKAAYSEKSFGQGVMPDDFTAYRKQRHRWVLGGMQIFRQNFSVFFSPFSKELSLGQKWKFITGWLPWIGDAFGFLFLLAGIGWSVGIILLPRRCGFPVALFMIPAIGIFAFKITAQLILYKRAVPCRFCESLGAILAGVSLNYTIAKAVWQSLLKKNPAFMRTPKITKAPALMQGLLTVKEEAFFLLAVWACMIGILLTQPYLTLEVKLWCSILFMQSLPYLAAVLFALAATFQGKEA